MGVQIDAHAIVYFVVTQCDVVLVNVVRSFQNNFLCFRSYLSSHQLLKVPHSVIWHALDTHLLWNLDESEMDLMKSTFLPTRSLQITSIILKSNFQLSNQKQFVTAN